MGMKASKEYSEDSINIPSLHRAIVSLMVLFFVYVLNQTDRQVLPVLIPAGLRCSFNSSDQCVLHMTNNKTPKCDPEDCIEFDDTQASCNPAAYSLISDYFLPLHRAKALSFYHFGIYLGAAIGYALGALSSVICWRWTFFSLSILGFVMVLVAAFVLREARGEAPLLKYGSYTVKETATLLITTKPYVMLTTAAAIRHIGGYALGTWLATFYMRRFSQDSVDYGITIALVVLFGGSLGCLIGGFLADRYSTSKRQAKAYVIAISQCIAAPCIVAPLLVPNVSTSYGLLILAYLTAETWMGCSAAIVQDLFAPSLRAQASAVYIAVCTIIGGSIGPSLVPLTLNVSGWDACNKGMGYALLTIVPTSYLISAFLFFLVGYMMTEEIIISDETIHLTYESSEHSYSVYDSSTEVESASIGSKRKRRSKSQGFTSSQHETQLHT